MGITSAFEEAEIDVSSNGWPSKTDDSIPFTSSICLHPSKHTIRKQIEVGGNMLETDEYLHFSLYALQELNPQEMHW